MTCEEGALALLAALALAACPGQLDPEAEAPRAAPAPPAYAAAPGERVVFAEWPRQRTRTGASWGAALTDIDQHLPASYGDTYSDADKVTHGHETSHGIHAHVRNLHSRGGPRVNAFYAMNDRVALVREPAMRKSHIGPLVPQGLRGPRFSLYLTGQTAWDDTPLYVWDEWVAYTNGAEVGVDRVRRGLWREGWRDAVMGPLEFTVYAFATAMAAEQRDPAALADPQLLEFLAWNTRRAMTLYRAGAVMDQFRWAEQDRYYEALRTGAAGEPIRAFSRRVFGEAWTNEVLLGNAPGDPGGGDAGGAGGVDAGGADAGGPSGLDAGPGMPDASPPPPDASAPPPGSDSDGDGVPDGEDLCSNTPAGAPVWKYGPWLGCAAGQYRDRDVR